MTEATLQREIQKALRAKGAMVSKVHGGPMQSIMLDLVGSTPDHRYFELEVKLPGSYPTPRQRIRIAELQAHGDITGVVRSVEEALAACSIGSVAIMSG